jgi:hypothetical protein
MIKAVRSQLSEPPLRDAVAADSGLRLGLRQRERLAWLAARNGSPRLWNGRMVLPAGIRSVIVTEAPTGPRIEMLRHALAPDAVVVIPYAENPVFDVLKSKLVEFGTIGAAGADGPHELWWGGLGWEEFPAPSRASDIPMIVSGYCTPDQADDAGRLGDTLGALGIPFDIRPVDGPANRMTPAKIALIHDAWRHSPGPVLWLDPATRVRGVPALPAAMACDFAVHKWRRWEFALGTLYFGRSAEAEALLLTWYGLAVACPDVIASHLLDQAWSLTASQVALDTIWLPRSYHAPYDAAPGARPVIVHDIRADAATLAPFDVVPAALEAARRACRIGAPEAHLVMAAPSGRRGVITVMMRDICDADATMVAAAVEAAAEAFASDSGGFSQLEMSLCRWDADIASIRRATVDTTYLVTTPHVRLRPDSFRQIGNGRRRDAALKPI